MNFAGPFDFEFSHDSPVSLGGERFAFDAKPGFVQHHASDGHVVVPDAHLLFSGDYTRIGSDLIISGNNQKFVVGNYFKGETRPALSTKDGATLGGHIVDALTGHVHYAQATAAPTAGTVIGTVQKMSGSASVIRNGVSVELQIGAAVQKGDVIQTGSNSSIGMTFVDGSAFGMTSNARMVLNEMIFDPNGSSNSSLMSLVQGTVTFVAGQTAKNGNMRVETPVATMGIRGTAVLVEIAANDGPTKFSVLVEPDGTTGSFNLYDKVTGQLIGTVSQAGQVTFVSSLGIGQPPTAIEQLKTLADQQAEKAIIQQVFQLYFPNYNPDDSNPKMPKFGSNSSGNNLAEILFTTNSNNKQTFLTQIELRFAVTDPLTGITTYQNRIFYNTKAQFSALAVTADQAFVSTTETFKFMDVVRIDDPDIGNAPFYDIDVPFVAGSAVITSAVSTIGHLTEAFLKPLLHINQTTGVVSFDREQFNFLDDGETVTFMIRVTATSGPDTGTVLIPVTITGENDAPTIVVGAATTITGDVKEDTDVTTSGDIVTNGTITFQDVDLTDVHTATVTLTSTASSLPGFVAGTEIGEFTIDPVSESTADTSNHGSVGWHFKLADNNSTLQSLAKDQTITQTYTITIKDDNGVPVTQTVTITITGTNDVPTITAADVTQADTIYEIPGQTGGTGFDQNANGDTPSGSIHFADIDLIDRPTPTTVSQVISYLSADGLDDLTSTLTPAQQSAIENAFKTSVPSGAGANTNNGVVDWTYELVDNVLDFLAENETIKLVSIVRISDGNGGFADATVTINIVGGANDTPSIAAIADVGFIEQADTSPLQQTIAVNFTDVDLTDTGHVASVESVTANGVLPPLTPTGPVTSGTFFDLLTAVSATKAAGDSSGSASFSFAADFTTFNYLALGETVTLTYIVAITDLAGTNGIQTVAVTITGTNDAPTVESVTTPTLVDTAAPDTFSNLTETLVGIDIDNGETNGLTYAAYDSTTSTYGNSAVVGQYGSLTVNSDGTYSYVPNAAAINALHAGSYTDTFTLQTTDVHGASGTATFTVNVTGANDTPVAVNDVASTSEGTATSGLGVWLKSNDSDVDGGALSITAVGNATHGTVALNGGDPIFTPDADFSGQASFDYTVSDGNGGTTTANVYIDVAPVADTPTSTIGTLTPVAAGAEFKVNSYNTGNQINSAVGARSDGSFVIAWASAGQDGSGDGVYGQLYDSSGNAFGSEFRINTATTGDQHSPFVAGLPGGGFVVSWTSGNNAASSIHAQRYDSAGAAIGGELLVSPSGEGSNIAVLPNGNFIISFIGSDSNIAGKFAQIYDPGGNVIVPAFQLNTTTANYQTNGSIAGTSDGGFIATWWSYGQDTSDSWGVIFQRFDAAGTKLGGEVQVNTTSAGNQTGGSVAVLTDGTFVVSWVDASTQLVSVQHFNADGSIHGSATVIGSGSDITVEALPDGGYIATYVRADAVGSLGLFGQRVDAADTLAGPAFQINQTVAGDQLFLSDRANPTAVLPSGDIVSTWYGPSASDGDQVYARLFSLPAIGTEDAAVKLTTFTTHANDADGSESIVLKLSGFPPGAMFSKGAQGTGADAGFWLISNASDIADLALHPLTVTTPSNYNDTFTLHIETITTDVATLSTGPATSTASVGHDLAVTVTPVNDAPVLNGDNVSVAEIGDGSPGLPYGTTKVLGITLSDVDAGADTFTVTAAADHGTLATAAGGQPLAAGVSGSFADISNLFNGGAVYTPDNTSPTDKVTLTVTDSHGGSDTLNFIFKQVTPGGVTLLGTTGKDIIFSSTGDDTMTGLAGQDNFVFAPASGHDTIMDFTVGNDKIDFKALAGMDVSALTNLLTTADHTGGDTLLHINGTTDTLLVKGVAALNASDFILHA